MEDGISAATLFFGSETGRGGTTPDQEQRLRNGLAISQPSSSSRKIHRDATLNGLAIDLHSSEPAPKRLRRDNGNEANNVDAMHLDQNGFNYEQREPPEPVSPGDYSATEDAHAVTGMDLDEDTVAAQDPQPILTLTNGQSVASQSDKVEDLSPTTLILTVADRDNIMHTTWNPRNSAILATGGDALCRLWHLTKEAMIAEQPKESPCHDILQPGDSSLVTSMAWSPDGRSLAVATRTDAAEMTGSVCTWTDMGRALDDLTAGQEMVIKLQWNATRPLLLGITSSGDGMSSLIVWEMDSSQALTPVQCDKIITDASWTGASTITVCGHGAIGRWDIYSQQGVIWALKANPQVAQGRWTRIIQSASTENIGVFDEDNSQLMVIDLHGTPIASQQAHKEAITAIANRPILNPMEPTSLLATCSLDGSINYWDTVALQPSYTLKFGQDSPPLALAFSPEGSLLAAASHSKVLVWETKGSNLPIASWKGDLGKAPKMALTNGHAADRDSGIGDDGTEDGMSEPSVSLDWDADGKRLALGVGNQVMHFHIEVHGKAMLTILRSQSSRSSRECHPRSLDHTSVWL